MKKPPSVPPFSLQRQYHRSADHLDRSRRQFIQQIAATTMAASGMGLTLSACGGGGHSDPSPPSDSAGSASNVQFLHGVASGDPLIDRVILWTRATPGVAATPALNLTWEIASDPSFSQIVNQGTATTDASQDYTVKVDATGLKPGTVYFYRFKQGSLVSPVGRTKTLPAAGIAQVKMAVLSCSDYVAGYFTVYAEATKIPNIDVALHIGDYIYEDGPGGYASEFAQQLQREAVPAKEITTLEDYRARHAQCKTDPDAQIFHAALPVIAVWDDHDIADNTWAQGAKNHQPDTEGDFPTRRHAALKAYLEWMPIRMPDPLQPERIYRSFDFGQLVSLHMLDTRIIGRDQQIELKPFIDSSNLTFNTSGFEAALKDPQRQLMGSEQTEWLRSQMMKSSATWQILGQQVLMSRMDLPLPVVLFLLSKGSEGVSLPQYILLKEKAQLTPGLLTPAEQAVLAQPSIPYNLDAWDGYHAARETVLGMAQTMDKNLVVLAGDTHNAWANNLATDARVAAGVEFATSSVTSPGLEEYLSAIPYEKATAFLRSIIEPLRYADVARRGWMVITATPTECRSDWYFVDSVRTHTATTSLERSLRVLPGATNRQLVEV